MITYANRANANTPIEPQRLHARPGKYRDSDPQDTRLAPQTPATETTAATSQLQTPLYLGGWALQPKLKISQPRDAYETEADRVAERITSTADCAAMNNSRIPRYLATSAQLSPSRLPGETQANSTLPGSTQINNQQGGGRRLNSAERTYFEPRFGARFDGVRIHEGAQAAAMARNINARAFTLGSDIFMGAGEYSHNTPQGRRLLAHELTHTLQQNGADTIRREVIDMEPMTVTPGGMPSDLSPLSTPVPADQASMSHTTATIENNSQLPATRLPFTTGGWDGSQIAGNLGQYDRIPGTDSDAVRCVQAVALLSHVLSGPEAAIGYLSAISAQAMLSGIQLGNRQRTAMRVIDHVQEQIRNQNATYGDMYWAMEAVHDLFYGDASGTPAETPDEARSQIAPAFDLHQTMDAVNTWCSSATELMSQAATLNPGEQFMLTTWTVSFNYYFDEIGAPSTQQRASYTQVDENDRPLRTVRIRRIDTSQGKPTPAQIDPNRDSRSGHQMLIYKDATDNHIKLYEPEMTTSGRHAFDLTADQSVLGNMLFQDQPNFELFRYVQLLGKITPSTLLNSFSAD